jgi:predicted MPP superfamily phosphohydrolase
MLVLALAGVALRGGLRLPDVRRVEITLERWPEALDGFRIVQISDIHIGPLLGRDFAERLTRRVNSLDPDLVAVTGDLVDGSVEALREEVAPFAELRGRHGVFFVTGNHDVYSGGESWVERVKELGLRVLRNERVEIGGADGFDLAGVDDHRGDWVHGSTEDVDAAVAGRDESRALILLAHDPGTFRRAAAKGVDLQLSGHTHGGQIWPFVYLVRLAVPFVAGLYRVGKSQVYVSRGSGFWGPPMRLLAPAEIGEIVLRSARS